MAKFVGIIGYAVDTETSPGIWEKVVERRSYRGDVLENQQKNVSTDAVNGEMSLNNSLSIIADSYANENAQWMSFVIWNGWKWKVTSVSIKRPRIIIHLGGIFR